MKKTNKKGFTLIELLAVIVILSILITISVPAVTRYLNSARRGTFVANVQSAISAVRTDVISSGITSDTIYYLNKTANGSTGVNDLLESGKTLTNSTYSSAFTSGSFIQVKFDANGLATYSACVVDTAGNGIVAVDDTGTPIQTANTDNSVLETSLNEANVVTGQGTVTCTPSSTSVERGYVAPITP